MSSRKSTATRHGERIWIEENVRLVRDEQNRRAALLRRHGARSHGDDAAARAAGPLQQDRLDHVGLSAAAARSGPDGTFHMPYASIGLYHMFGIRPEEVAEDSTVFRNLIHRDDYKRVEQAMMHSHETLTPFQQEYRLCLADGTVKWVLAHSVPEREADGSTLWHGYMVDISDRKRSEAKIHELAYFDALTHLPNRIPLRERLQRALAPGERKAGSALLFVDLDHFKVLNDTKGHHVGDLLLCEVAKRICDGLAVEDFVARLGGDEFVILLTGLSEDREGGGGTGPRQGRGSALGNRSAVPVRRGHVPNDSEHRRCAPLGFRQRRRRGSEARRPCAVQGEDRGARHFALLRNEDADRGDGPACVHLRIAQGAQGR